jgi:hypothetical protein
MKVNTFIKGLVMAVVGFVASLYANAESVSIAFVAISTIAFTLMYLGKNWKFPSKTNTFGMDTQDWLSGLFIFVSMALSSSIASFIVDGHIEWMILLKSSGGACIGYLAKTFSTQPKIAA